MEVPAICQRCADAYRCALINYAFADADGQGCPVVVEVMNEPNSVDGHA